MDVFFFSFFFLFIKLAWTVFKINGLTVSPVRVKSFGTRVMEKTMADKVMLKAHLRNLWHVLIVLILFNWSWHIIQWSSKLTIYFPYVIDWRNIQESPRCHPWRPRTQSKWKRSLQGQEVCDDIFKVDIIGYIRGFNIDYRWWFNDPLFHFCSDSTGQRCQFSNEKTVWNRRRLPFWRSYKKLMTKHVIVHKTKNKLQEVIYVSCLV